MADRALNVLGLSYAESDEDESDEDDGDAAVAAAPIPVAVAAAAASAGKATASSSLLPDASKLGLPDEEDWEGVDNDGEDEEPAYDAVGTKYNAVALPTSMANDADKHNSRAGQKPGQKNFGSASTKAAIAEALAATNTMGSCGGATCSSSSNSSSSNNHVAPPAASSAGKPAPSRKGGVMMPPQLRRGPNVTTEELSAIRTAKRPKQS